MSTRSRIGMQLPDGTIKSIYCHHDGYPEGVGKMLKEYHNNERAVDELLELGDISSLGEFYDADIAKKRWTYEELTPEEEARLSGRKVTVSYKDRGEDCPARVDKNLGVFLSNLGACGEEYTYVYLHTAGGYKWYMHETPTGKDLEKLLEGRL